MKVLGLDLSTKSGWAIIEDGNLTERGLVKIESTEEFSLSDLNMVIRAIRVAEDLAKIMLKQKPDLIIIEQTNSGRFRTSQKQLEFIHFTVLCACKDMGLSEKIRYMDTSAWRKALKISLSKEQRENNKRVKNKLARGKITPKHLAVAWANQTYQLQLKLKDNDQADAIALASVGYQNSLKKDSTESLDSALLYK